MKLHSPWLPELAGERGMTWYARARPDLALGVNQRHSHWPEPVSSDIVLLGMSLKSEKRRDSIQIECIACRNGLEAGASLCSHCGSFQSAWKNHLRYWATLVGLVAFIFTAVAYLFSVGPEIRKTFAWEDRIKVLDVILPGFIVVANTGDGNVFVQKLHWTGNIDNLYSTDTIPINKAISKEQGLETIELKRSSLEKKEFLGRYMGNKEVPKELRAKVWQEARSDNNECLDVKIQLVK